MSDRRQQTTVGIAGLGTVGRVVAEHLAARFPMYRLTSVASGNEERARAFLDQLPFDHAIDIVPAGELWKHAELIVECAPPQVFREIAGPVVESGRVLMTINSGALLESWDLVDQAERTGAQILLPSGALLGLDAVQGAAQSEIHSIRMVTRKPPKSLQETPYVRERDIDLTDLSEPLKLFEGTVREAIVGFPNNLNVAVALSLAGIGPDKTMIEVWADEALERNTHFIDVESDSARLHFSIENVISDNYEKPEGRRSHAGRLTALSMVALLRKRASALQIGT
jgi:aspartate dehydrogenase